MALLAAAPAAHARTLVLGRSSGGRRIVAIRAGDPRGPRVLVVGSVHGNELAGLAVARALARVHRGADLWIVPDLNPDGAARGTRQNARGVDLNANWSSQWRGGGRPFDVYYGGRGAFFRPPTPVPRRALLRARPPAPTRVPPPPRPPPRRQGRGPPPPGAACGRGAGAPPRGNPTRGPRTRASPPTRGPPARPQREKTAASRTPPRSRSSCRPSA